MEPSMSKFDFQKLRELVTGNGVAFRVHQTLQPAGGAGDKVFPPTFAVEGNALRYTTEVRRINGEDVTCVLLDSVASQANRMEEALLAAWETSAISFPVLSVDFGGEQQLADIGRITTLDAPHRIADAILRDSVEPTNGTLFRGTPEGRAYTDATPDDATAVFLLCPTALIFGVWDSTGPKGGGGAKFQRALTSEIVAIRALAGAKVASRLDPLAIQANVPVYHRAADENDWTIDKNEAKTTDRGVPVLFSRSGGEGKGKPSSVNHSNIAPSIDTTAGGITFDRAVQTVVLSLPALRKLRFRTNLEGQPLSNRDTAESAARVALAALGIAAIVHQRQHGYDLRSRCLLVPDSPFALEVITADGSGEQYALTPDDANDLVSQAGAACAAAGLAWMREPLQLRPAPKLAALVRRSREVAAAGNAEAE
jgi:CRISPR-associated protein Csb1